MLHVGMDMHKRYSVVTVIDEKGKEVVTGRRLHNETGEIKDFLEGLDHQRMKVVLEAGQNWCWMCDMLEGLWADRRLSHPLKTKAIASAKIKRRTRSTRGYWPSWAVWTLFPRLTRPTSRPGT